MTDLLASYGVEYQITDMSTGETAGSASGDLEKYVTGSPRFFYEAALRRQRKPVPLLHEESG